MEKYLIDDPAFKAIIRAENVALNQIDMVMNILYQYLAANWYVSLSHPFITSSLAHQKKRIKFYEIFGLLELSSVFDKDNKLQFCIEKN